MGDNCKNGAVIQRGEVVGVENGGCIVRSLTKYGIITPVLPTYGYELYGVGDMVYYFAFPDGTGMIMTKIPER